MKDPTTAAADKFEALARWRNLAVDRAQLVHAQKQTIAAGNAAAVDAVQTIVDDSQNQMREQTLTDRIISADSLTRLRHFTTVQIAELKQAQHVLSESRRAASDARAALQKKVADLAVVERLRKRRGTQADKELLRREQRRLDDQASLRAQRSTHDELHQPSMRGKYGR